MKKLKINDLNKYIDDVLKNVSTNETRLHNAAYACIEAAMKNGEKRPAIRLVEGLGKRSIRANALIKYLCHFGPFSYDTETKVFDLDKSKKGAKQGTFAGDLEGAWEKPFWEFKAPEGEDMQAFDLPAAMKKLAERVAKRVQNAHEQDNIPPHLLAILQEEFPQAFQPKQKKAKKVS